MGRSTRSVIRDRIPQAVLDKLIERPTEKIDPHPILTSTIEYDTTHPEETVKNYCDSIRNMLSRYQYDKDQLSICEQQMQDLLHFIELGSDKNANIGFKLYKQLAEVRRQRRICKNEMDLLQPIYDEYGDGSKLNVLSRLLGDCRFAKQSIDNRSYTVRTDVLDSYVKINRE